MDEKTLLEVYKAVKEQRNKCEEERIRIINNNKLTDEQKQDFLDENFGIIIGLNQALAVIRNCK